MPKFGQFLLTTGTTRHVALSEDDCVNEMMEFSKAPHFDWIHTVEGDVVNPANVVYARLVDLESTPGMIIGG